MTPTMYAAVAFMITGSAAAALAWDIARRYIDARVPRTLTSAAQERFTALEAELESVSAALQQSNAAQAQLARDWLKKFAELENKWKQLEDHVGSKVAGQLAQLPGRGYGR